jgi:hypothetical protein
MNSQTNLLVVTPSSSTSLQRNDARLRELEHKICVGTGGGFAGFDDSPVKRVCPSYGQMN